MGKVSMKFQHKLLTYQNLITIPFVVAIVVSTKSPDDETYKRKKPVYDSQDKHRLNITLSLPLPLTLNLNPI